MHNYAFTHTHTYTRVHTYAHTHTHSQAYTHIHNSIHIVYTSRIIVLSFGYRYKTKLKHQEKVTTQLEQDHATTLVRYLLRNNTTELSLYGCMYGNFSTLVFTL